MKVMNTIQKLRNHQSARLFQSTNNSDETPIYENIEKKKSFTM